MENVQKSCLLETLTKAATSSIMQMFSAQWNEQLKSYQKELRNKIQIKGKTVNFVASSYMFATYCSN